MGVELVAFAGHVEDADDLPFDIVDGGGGTGPGMMGNTVVLRTHYVNRSIFIQGDADGVRAYRLICPDGTL
jgi:hypothetical protein